VLEQALSKLGFSDINIKQFGNSVNGIFKQDDVKLFALFENLSSFTSDKFSHIREAFLRAPRDSWTRLDQARITSLLRILEDCSTYASQRVFWDKERLYLQIASLLSTQIEDCHEKPTTLSIEKLYPALKTVQSLLLNDYQNLELQEPVFELNNVLDNNRYSVDADGFVSLKLQLSSTNESAPPVTSMRIFPEDKNRDFEGGVFPEAVAFGKKEFEFRIRPTDQEILDKAFSLSLV